VDPFGIPLTYIFAALLFLVGIVLTLQRALRSADDHHAHTLNEIDQSDAERDKRIREVASDAGKRKAAQIRAMERD
jgi:hypothetical protein